MESIAFENFKIILWNPVLRYMYKVFNVINMHLFTVISILYSSINSLIITTLLLDDWIFLEYKQYNTKYEYMYAFKYNTVLIFSTLERQLFILKIFYDFKQFIKKFQNICIKTIY